MDRQKMTPLMIKRYDYGKGMIMNTHHPVMLTQCSSFTVCVWGGPPCHQLKPKEDTTSVTFPTSFSRACLASSAPSSEPAI